MNPNKTPSGPQRAVPGAPLPLDPDHTPLPEPPREGDHLDVEATLTQLHGLTHQLLKKQTQPPGVTAELAAMVDRYEKQLSPWRKVWMFILGLAAAAAFVFGVGVSYQQFMGGNATKGDIEDGIKEHTETELEPVREDVTQIKQDMEPVKKGVEALVEAQDDERTLKRLKHRLERHDKEYQEALQEYTADKAAGRRARRPRKTEAHIALEAEVKEAEDKL